MIALRSSIVAAVVVSSLNMAANTMAADAKDQTPQAEITNGVLRVKLYLPDPEKGYYRGTRFDWSGVINSLEYEGHQYYGPWFTKTDPKVIDFIFDGADIVAGPCSAIMGPVEEFSSNEKALGYDDAKPGGTFIKIGVGVLRKPDDSDYTPYRLYDIVDSGKWKVRTEHDSIEFTQELADPTSGYAYAYTKVVRLVKDKPEMVLQHSFKNTGRRPIDTSVYDHNFLVLDKQPIGPDFTITVPFEIKTERPPQKELAEVRGNRLVYLKALQGKDTVAASFSGFGNTTADYGITIENSKVGAGMKITGDRPLSQESLWSIRSVLAMEPFIHMIVEPGKQFTWSYTYSYYSLTH
ncbi:MAG: hypothetical protein ACR2JB_24065 [Bryobacteraceae bacterium]